MANGLVSTRVFLLALVLASALVELSVACGAHGEHGHDHWSQTIELQGRRRSLLSRMGRKCGTEDVDKDKFDEVERKHGSFMRKEAFVKGAGPNGERIYQIPTWVTVVLADDGSKNADIPDAVVKRQLQLMNDAYAVNAVKYGVKWEFKLMRIKRVTGPSMCDKGQEQALKKQHRQGGPGELNLYFTDLGECGLLGFSTWPWQVKESLTNDGVVIHYDTMPGGKEAPYNMGRTCIHETGHWMGLYHTFQNGCMRGGDMVTDTPFSAGPTQGCPAARNSCTAPGTDPIHNYMDYSDDNCMHQFSEMQHQRMEGQYRQYRMAGDAASDKYADKYAQQKAAEAEQKPAAATTVAQVKTANKPAAAKPAAASKPAQQKGRLLLSEQAESLLAHAAAPAHS